MCLIFFPAEQLQIIKRRVLVCVTRSLNLSELRDWGRKAGTQVDVQGRDKGEMEDNSVILVCVYSLSQSAAGLSLETAGRPPMERAQSS